MIHRTNYEPRPVLHIPLGKTAFIIFLAIAAWAILIGGGLIIMEMIK